MISVNTGDFIGHPLPKDSLSHPHMGPPTTPGPRAPHHLNPAPTYINVDLPDTNAASHESWAPPGGITSTSPGTSSRDHISDRTDSVPLCLRTVVFVSLWYSTISWRFSRSFRTWKKWNVSLINLNERKHEAKTRTQMKGPQQHKKDESISHNWHFNSSVRKDNCSWVIVATILHMIQMEHSVA